VAVKETFDNSEKFTLDSTRKFEDSLTYKSYISNETIEESTNKSLTILSAPSILESSESEVKLAIENEKSVELPLLLMHQNIVMNPNNFSSLTNQLDNSKNITSTLSNNSNLNTDESNDIDVEEISDSSFADESIIQVHNIKSVKDELNLDPVELSLKDSYVKLNRANEVEKLLDQKKDKRFSNEKNIDLDSSNSTNKDSVIANVMPAIVLVNDIVKNNQSLDKKLYDTEIISSSLECSDIITKNIKVNKNNEDPLKETSINENDDINVIIVSADDEKEDSVIVNKRFIENSNYIDNDNDNEKKNYIYITDTTDDGSENSISIHENSNALENIIPANEYNNEINKSNFVNTNENSGDIDVIDNESECLTLIKKNKNEIEDEESNSIFVNANTDETENSILIHKNINLVENSVNINEINKEVKSSIFMNKNENEIVNTIDVKESVNSEHIFVNQINDEAKNSVCVNENRDEGKNSPNSTVSVESKSTCDEKDSFITMKQDSNPNDSISLQIPKELNVTPSKLVSINKEIDNSSTIFLCEDNESVGSVSTNQINKINDLNINNKMDTTSFVIKHDNEMETDQNTDTIPENVKNIDIEVTLEPTELNIPDIDLKQNKMCSVGKNSVSSAVTDADGENASTPEKMEVNEEVSKQAKKPEKFFKKEQKRNSQVHDVKTDDSDSDNSCGNLFQDIPAEEWSHQIKQNRLSNSKAHNEDENEDEITTSTSSINQKDSSLKESTVQEDDNSRIKKNRKSLNDKAINKSLEHKLNDINEQQNNESPFKKARKSLEKRRESNQMMNLKDTESKKSISEIEERNQIEIEDDIDSDKDENKSPNKRQASFNKSLKLNRSSHDHTDESMSEKMSSSMSENRSFQKNQRSAETSLCLNQSSSEENQNKSISETSSNSINNSSFKQSSENLSDEAMDVDEENSSKDQSREIYNKFLNENKKDLSKSQMNNSVLKNKSISENLSTTLNNSKQSKRLSTNSSFKKSLVEEKHENNSSSDETEITKDVNNDKSTNDENNSKLERKQRKSLNKSNLLNQSSHLEMENASLIEKLSNSLNSSKKLKNRLSDKMQPHNESSHHLLKTDKILKNESDNEMKVKENGENFPNKKKRISLDKSSNDKSLNVSKCNEHTVLNTTNEVSFKNKNKLLKNIHSKSTTESDSDEDATSETNEEYQENNEKTGVKDKSLNVSSTSHTSINNTSEKSFPTNSTKELDSSDESDSNYNLSETKESSANCDNNLSIEKNSERIKFINPMKHDLPGSAQPKSDSESGEVPEYKLQISDDESEISENEEENSSGKDIDSDVAKEYNLSGKSTQKYSDDDVPGDDCRASEEEFSDDDDDGKDLTDFIVPDDEVQESEDGGDAEGNDEESDSDDNENNEARRASHCIKKDSLGNSKLNTNGSANNSKLKNNASFNKSCSIKDKSIDNSKLKNNASFNKSSSIKDKSIDNSKSMKTNKENSMSRKCAPNNTKSLTDKRSDTSEAHHYSESVSSDAEDEEITKNVTSEKSKTLNIASSSSESESEEGEDSYEVITVGQTSTSCSLPVSSKAKKLTALIECSTPKPGVIKKNDFSKSAYSFGDTHSLPLAENKSNSTRRKSESLYDLSDTKMVSSRMSIPEVTSKSTHESSAKFKESVGVVDSPESIIKHRQAWKLIPLNQTAHALNDQTPVTKYLKKSKLNDSAPNSDRRKSDAGRLDVAPRKDDSINKKPSKKSKKIEEIIEVTPISLPIDKKSKKRKLLDTSNLNSVNDDSTLKAINRKKKRARLEESVNEEPLKWEIESKEAEEEQRGQKMKKSRKNGNAEESVEEAVVPDLTEDTEQSKKKKRRRRKKKTNNNNNNSNNNDDDENKVEADASKEEAIVVPDVVKDIQRAKKDKKSSKIKEATVEQPVVLESSQDSDVKREKNMKKKKNRKNREKEQVARADENERKVEEAEEASSLEAKKHKKRKARSIDEGLDKGENLNAEAPLRSQRKPRPSSDMETQQREPVKKSKRKSKNTSEEKDGEEDDENSPQSVGFEEARQSALMAMQREVEAVRAQKLARKKKPKVEQPAAPSAKMGIKRLPDDILEALTDEPEVRKANKRPKLASKPDPKVVTPSTSMFSPGKKTPANLRIDDDYYMPLNLDGGTTEFGVVNLDKAKKFVKKNTAAISFRERMLSRNLRQPTSTYLAYLKKQKSKSSF
jgi:hypothetical protein